MRNKGRMLLAILVLFSSATAWAKFREDKIPVADQTWVSSDKHTTTVETFRDDIKEIVMREYPNYTSFCQKRISDKKPPLWVYDFVYRKDVFNRMGFHL